MASWGNKVEECMDTVVTETAVSLNPGFFRQNVIILLLKVSQDFLEAIRFFFFFSDIVYVALAVVSKRTCVCNKRTKMQRKG